MENSNNTEQQSKSASSTQLFVERFKRPLLLACVLVVFVAFAATVYAFVQEAPEDDAGVHTPTNSGFLQTDTSDTQNISTENTNGDTNGEATESVSDTSVSNTAPAVNTANTNTVASQPTSAPIVPTTNTNTAVETTTNAARPANTNTAVNTAPVTNERDTQPIEQYTAVVTVQGTGSATTYNVSVPVGASVADLMALARQKGLSYTTKQFGGLGMYVNSMNGLSEDTNAGMYWVYRVNNVKATAGISTKTLNRGDSVQWRYEHEQ